MQKYAERKKIRKGAQNTGKKKREKNNNKNTTYIGEKDTRGEKKNEIRHDNIRLRKRCARAGGEKKNGIMKQ